MTVVLFDIDGTLLRTGGAGGRAMARASQLIFDAASTAASIASAGRTDSWIVAEMAARYGQPFEAELLADFRNVYVQFLNEEMGRNGTGQDVLPGVPELLAALSARRDVFVGLLTGNFQQSAHIKLEHFGLRRYFRSGGFGDDSRDRKDLLPVALERIAAGGGPLVSPADVTIVGDTPFDVEVAVAGGAVAVTVATGPFGVEALHASGAHVVLPDLQDCDRALQAIIGRGRSPIPPSPGTHL